MNAWQLIQTAPTDGRRLLCWHAGFTAVERQHFSPVFLYWSEAYECWVGDVINDIYKTKWPPTHWLEIPELPA